MARPYCSGHGALFSRVNRDLEEAWLKTKNTLRSTKALVQEEGNSMTKLGDKNNVSESCYYVVYNLNDEM